MKNSLKYFLLWQKKRRELPVQEDPQHDWDQMESLLDEHMPVKKSGGFKGLKTLPALFITFSAAAMIYLAGNIYSLEKHNRNAKHHFHKGNAMRPEQPFADSSSLSDSKTDNDSIQLTNKNEAAKDSIAPGGTHGGNSTVVDSKSNSKNNTLSKEDQPASRSAPGNGHVLSAVIGHKNSGIQNAIINNTSGRRGGGSPGYGANGSRPGAANGKLTKAADKNKASGGVILNNINGNLTKAADQYRPGRDTIGNNYLTRIGVDTDIFNNKGMVSPLTAALHHAMKFDMDLTQIKPLSLSALNSFANKKPTDDNKQTKGGKKNKPAKPQNSNPSKMDWGILLGVNTAGSFTPKSQNANFYGSAPIDPYFGLFATYKINRNWAITPQVRFFSPQNISTTYTHANQSKVDSNQSLTITASRKMYAVSVPIYFQYNTGNGLDFKAGPVINFPVKQINTTSILLPYSIRTDTSYYKNISAILNATQYHQNINFGFSIGASYQYKRFIFETIYLKSLSGYTISNGLGSYKSNNGTFQFTIGFQLDKVKP